MTKDFWAGVIRFVAGLELCLFLLLASALINAWVLRYLWGWFVTPNFHVAVPGYWMMAGIAMTVRYMTVEYTGEDKRKTSEKIIYAMVLPPMGLFCGWIYHVLSV